MSISTSSNKKNIFDGRRLWFIFAGLASVAVAVLAFGIMQTVTATDTYYVLKQDVPARTQITPSLLQEESTSAGKVPPTALDISQIGDETYSKYALKAGDILTQSNTGAQLSITKGLPKDYVISSFTADPSTAAGGKVQRGDYVDIMAVSESPDGGYAANYVLQRVLVVDATVDLDSYDSSASSDSSGSTSTGATDASSTSGASTDSSTGDNSEQIAQRSGIPTMFTVGLTQENAARLAVAQKYDLVVVLSSQQSANDDKVSATPGSADSGILGDANVPNAGEGTDNTFGQSGKKKVDKPSGEATSGATSAPTDAATSGTGESTDSGTEFGTDSSTSDGSNG